MTMQIQKQVYAATAYRDGKWWTFEIPSLNSPAPRGGDSRIVAMGQSQTVGKLDEAVREVAALWLDVDESQVDVHVTIRLPDDVKTLWAKANEREEHARQEVREAARLRREAVRALTAQGISQVDAARVLGLSPQRISQLART